MKEMIHSGCHKCERRWSHGDRLRALITNDGVRAVCEGCFTQEDEIAEDPYYKKIMRFSLECADRVRVTNNELEAMLGEEFTKRRKRSLKLGLIMRSFGFRPSSVRNHRGIVVGGWARG